MSLVNKVRKYAEKFKIFDESIIDGVALCYKHSPILREHIDSHNFGETLGWRITWLWTKNVKEYEELELIGPLDLGLYALRIDDILGQTNLEPFLVEAENKPVFKKYITATVNFISELIRRNDVSWMTGINSSSLESAVNLCSKYSPTLKKIMERGKGDGWKIVRLWTPNPEKITALRNIYPLDVAIYCVRLDSITHGINLTDFGKEANEISAFKLFPKEVVRFILQVLAEGYS